jgi:hypothetical protein
MTTDDKPQDTGASASAEIWLAVVGFEGFYEVCSGGAVRSLRYDPPKIICATLDKDGYPTVRLFKFGRRTTIKLHRVVCQAFNGPGNALHNEVAHLDGDRGNANAANLKWVSRAENCSHKRRHGTHQVGDSAGNRILSSSQVAKIRQRRATAEVLGQQYGVSRHTIYDIWRGRRWVNV